MKYSPVKKASKVTVKPLISRYKLVWERQTWHQSPLFKPEYGTKAENTSERNKEN